MPKPAYPFTPDDEANALLARDGTAFLIGLLLEQQVRSEKAFVGPSELRKRIGPFDARAIAQLRPARLDKAFRTPPALHRYPRMMAKRVQTLCRCLVDEYGGDGARVWARVRDAKTLYERLRALPGFGDGKAACGVRILARYGGKPLAGWQSYAADADLPWTFTSGKRETAPKAPLRRPQAARGARSAPRRARS